MPNATGAHLAPSADLRELGEEWDLSLAARNLSPKTRTTYGTAVTQFAAFLDARKLPTDVAVIRRDQVAAFLADLLARGKSPSTAKTRFGGLQAFFNWCVEEGELADTPMAKMKPPQVPDQPVDVLTDDQIAALLKVCEGRDFYARRDTAIVRVTLGGGMRRAEVTNLLVEDIDFAQSVIWVLGKGGRRRACPFGDKTALALRRYLRAREGHPDAASPRLWLGRNGPIGYHAIPQVFERRGTKAGITFHPHQLRHTFAHLFLEAGGTERDLMSIAGWRSRQMLDRYARSTADQRARDAYKRLGVDDRF